MSFRSVVVSAGGTREPWDEVRFLGNRSTGRQGCEVARAALETGADVTLVAANVEAALIPHGVKVVEAPTAEDMLRQMHAAAAGADLVVMCAAVADFRPIRVSGKITRHDATIPTLELERTPDVLMNLIEHRRENQTIVGFGALTGSEAQVREQGRKKALAKGADLLCVNRVGDGHGFATETNTLIFFDSQGTERGQASGTKLEVAEVMLRLAGEISQSH
ncbi:phosphopantothenoylcysteine decarboxylase [uncultured Mobiluncus sp.]|uniref:phosphopantothenoylcysteine decarboxylase domain-containing protein n=1 Tax=uncultured Mobiluncus sp. TaxID=293425 RepID=UPI0026129E11|nr:phosphopantothenoylcysteine decarboxylase [uncultured Mobiluncus sp.]